MFNPTGKDFLWGGQGPPKPHREGLIWRGARASQVLFQHPHPHPKSLYERTFYRGQREGGVKGVTREGEAEGRGGEGRRERGRRGRKITREEQGRPATGRDGTGWYNRALGGPVGVIGGA